MNRVGKFAPRALRYCLEFLFHTEISMKLIPRCLLPLVFTALLAACVSAPPKPGLAQVGIYAAGPGSAFLPYAQGLAAYLSAQGLKASALE